MSAARPPTLKNIAEMVGTTPGTVSRVLNDKGKEIRLSDGMISRVKAVADELGYTPNKHAKNLKLGISNTIGVAVSTTGAQNELTYRLFKGMSEAAIKYGKSILYFDSKMPEENIDALQKCIDARVDGIIR
ncbi:MAG: LacI family DNA-binding transcriptional regulator [Planctomycetota bacterium]